MSNRNWTSEEHAQLALLYPNRSVTIQEIAVTLNRTVNAVHVKAKKLGISRPLCYAERTAVCKQCGQRFDVRKGEAAKDATYCGRKCGYDAVRGIDTDIFSLRTPDVAYWAGFLMADGCVVEAGGSCSIRVSLSDNDAVHLETFKSFLGTNNTIGFRRSSASISVGSREMASDLVWWGVVPRKTYVGLIPDHIRGETLQHYLRGLVDGDGGLYIRPRGKNGAFWKLALTNNDAVVSKFANVLSTLEIPYHRHIACTNAEGHSTHTISVQSKPHLQSLLKWLHYDGDGPALPRKAEAARTIISTPL